MPMINSHTDEAREKNIQEMIDAGHDPKQAVAAGYAHQEKMKKMASGGEVIDDFDDDASSDMDQEADRSLGELRDLGASHPETIQNPEQHELEMRLAKKLYDATEAQELYSGGMVEEELEDVNSAKKTIIVSATGEPMSVIPSHPGPDMLSQAAREALAKKKKASRYFKASGT